MPAPTPNSEQPAKPQAEYNPLEYNAEYKLLYLQGLVADNAYAAITEFLAQQSEYEIANLLESFPNQDRQIIWAQVPDHLKGEVLAELEVDTRQPLMENISSKEISLFTQDLDAQDISEILETVTETVRTSVMATLDEDVRIQVNKLDTYADWEVGSYMDPDTIQVQDDISLGQVQEWLRENEDLLDDQSQELLVVDQSQQLLGLLSLVDLIKHNQKSLVSSFTDNAITINDRLDIQDAAAIFRSEDIRFAPVINSHGELVGQLNGEDIMEIIQDDVDSTMKNLAGVSQDEELFAPILTSAKSRSIWLGINLCTALLAAAVIGQFEAVLAKVVALAILMPVVASMGGIAGSQTLTIVIRGMAMGQIGGSNRLWLFNKELWVGAINGLIWAIIMAIIAQMWFHDVKISAVIGFAIAINMTAANVSGISIPLMLKRMNIDPALSASVILTTVTDIVGFMSFLGLASVLLL
ncbi:MULTISPECIES: magnesium transporter [unclassified Psychrobacter]|uniref:magnesium transporter n=1 Tax=unclassified Psychrobacter TaxID=196806 RepID=UPI00078EDC0E|nr:MULTISPECIES: magnesium transporter [unclassified Psychrobacter]AMN49055.1 magnesium transporter [Psychrobacter sp. P2G3]AMN66873.1 magnesium transporter [Psychrobacter sp. P11G5]